MTPVLVKQVCSSCQKLFSLSSRENKCPACNSNVEFTVAIKKDNRFKNNIVPRDDLWRYQKYLPIDPRHIVSAGEGNTPIVYLDDLSKKLGIHLFVKDESKNPTGTFKDREASIVVSRSLSLKKNNLVLQSTGNTGLAITYYAGLAGLNSYFFGPKISAYKLFIPEKRKSNKIILIDGTPLEIKNYAENFSKTLGFNKIAPFSERCEANVTLAYEDFEAGFSPEYYIQTVAAGMGPIGYFTGYKRLAEWGEVAFNNLPKIIGVQISQFNPLYRGWHNKKTAISPKDNTTNYPPSPYEPTLFTTNAPAYYPQFKSIIDKSGGTILETSPAETKASQDLLIESLRRYNIELNVEAEKSPFIGFAGLIQAIKQDMIPKKSKVLLLITGKGAHVKNKVRADAIIRPDHPITQLMKDLEK